MEDDIIFELPPEQAQRLDEILGDRTEIPADFEGFTDEEAVEIISILYGSGELTPLGILAMMRGEIDGDCIAIDPPLISRPVAVMVAIFLLLVALGCYYLI